MSQDVSRNASRSVSDNLSRKEVADPAAAQFLTFAEEDAEDRRVIRSSLWIAAVVHVGLFLINFPAAAPEPLADEKPKKVFVVQQPIWKPPPVEPVSEIPPKRVKRTPMPDPTPDEPEPLPVQEPPPEIELPVPDISFEIPTSPPPLPEPSGPIQVGGDVQRPVKVHAPTPVYPEIARRARIQGVVIVQAIIDKQGHVTHVKELKGLPMGLTEAAIRAVKTWKFEPATLNGKPVTVYYNLTINFGLK